MSINDLFKKHILLAPTDGSGGAGGEGGEDTAAGASGDDTLAAGAGNDTIPGSNDTAKWWDGGKFSDDHRTSLTALGLTTDDPVEAIPKLLDMEAAAKNKLGASPDQLMSKPKEGQDAAEWLRENGDMFGIPDKPENYEIERPKDWPKERAWDQPLEDQARKIAHEEGIPTKALNRMVELFAGKMLSMEGDAADGLAASEQKMMDALKSDWGDQTAGKIAQAQQAMSVIAEQAGFEKEAILSVASVLTEKGGGDANVIRLFSTIGEMMGEDTLVSLHGGNSGLSTTPAEARAELQRLRSPDGEYGKAFAEGNSAKLNELVPRIEELTKLASGG